MFSEKRMNSRYYSLGKYWIPFFLCNIWINSSGRSIRNAFLNDTLVCTRVWRPSAHTVRPKTPESAVPVQPPSEAISFHRPVPVRYCCRYRGLIVRRSSSVVGCRRSRWPTYAYAGYLKTTNGGIRCAARKRQNAVLFRSRIFIPIIRRVPVELGISIIVGTFVLGEWRKTKKPKSAHSRLTARGQHLPVDQINGKPRLPPPSIGSTD